MKYLLLFFTSFLFAQLPSSGTLSISMINTELGRSSNTANSSLQALANLARSDSTPYINRANPRISHWYGYKHSVVPSYAYSTHNSSSSSRDYACNNYRGDVVILYSSSITLSNGMTLHTSPTLSAGSRFVGSNNASFLYFKIVGYSCIISLSGVVSDLQVCSAPDTTPPNPPSYISAYNMYDYNFVVEWLGASDNVGVTGYEVYRDGYLIQEVSSAELSIVDFNVCGGNHSYYVKSIDAAGNRSLPSWGVDVDSFNPDQCW
jgi:hypothetical protein